MYKSKLRERPRVKFTIALIESSADDVVSFKCSLNAIGASPTVQIYETVAAAIEAFETAPPPDLIVVTLGFPNIVQELRRIPGYEEVPVAMFIDIDEMKKTPARLAGKAELIRVAACLSRPVDDGQLRDLLSKVRRDGGENRSSNIANSRRGDINGSPQRSVPRGVRFTKLY